MFAQKSILNRSELPSNKDEIHRNMPSCYSKHLFDKNRWNFKSHIKTSKQTWTNLTQPTKYKAFALVWVFFKCKQHLQTTREVFTWKYIPPVLSFPSLRRMTRFFSNFSFTVTWQKWWSNQCWGSMQFGKSTEALRLKILIYQILQHWAQD